MTAIKLTDQQYEQLRMQARDRFLRKLGPLTEAELEQALRQAIQEAAQAMYECGDLS